MVPKSLSPSAPAGDVGELVERLETWSQKGVQGVAGDVLLYKLGQAWAFLQGEHGVKLSSEDEDDHNVHGFFASLRRAGLTGAGEK